MITPIDIQNVEFKKTFRGYDIQEVDDFLKRVKEGYEKSYKENIEYQDKIDVLIDRMSHYDKMEETLKETLVIAQATAADVVKSAQKKAELIIEEAEQEARDEIAISKETLRILNSEYDNLKKQVHLFQKKYTSFLKSQLLDLENYTEASELDKFEYAESKIKEEKEEKEEACEIDLDENVEA